MVGKVQLEDWRPQKQRPRELSQAVLLVPNMELIRTMGFLSQQIPIDILGTDLGM